MIALLNYAFSADGFDYIEDVLVLLSAYLHRVPFLTLPLWFYYHIVVYNLVGIPNQIRDNLNLADMTQEQKQVMKSVL